MTVVRESSKGFPAATMVLVSLGAVTMIAHAFTGAGFGFHGDELQFMDDARHLAWGYVAYPPMTTFFARLSLDLFGTSIAGFRFFASLAQAVAIILTGLMAREMGRGVRGMMAKYAMAFFAVAIVTGFLVTDASRWLWAGCAAALLIWAPNLVWEARHHFVSFDLLRSIHARDVSQGRTRSFLPDQITHTIDALWIAGLFFCLKSDLGNDSARWGGCT